MFFLLWNEKRSQLDVKLLLNLTFCHTRKITWKKRWSDRTIWTKKPSENMKKKSCFPWCFFFSGLFSAVLTVSMTPTWPTCHPHLLYLSTVSVVWFFPSFPLNSSSLPRRSQWWSSSTKADVRAGLLGGKLIRWTQNRDGFWHLVKLSPSLGIRLGRENGQGAAAALRPSGPSILARHWIFNVQGPHKCMDSMVLSPPHILSLIKH